MPESLEVPRDNHKDCTGNTDFRGTALRDYHDFVLMWGSQTCDLLGGVQIPKIIICDMAWVCLGVLCNGAPREICLQTRLKPGKQVS